MDWRVNLRVIVFLCLFLVADSYIERSSVLIDSLTRDLSTNFNPLLKHHAPWYIHWEAWLYVMLGTVSPLGIRK